MTGRDWLVEPSIARSALAVISGARALDVALHLAASVSRGYGLPGPDGWSRDLSSVGKVLVAGLADSSRLREADADRAHMLELRDAEGNPRAFTLDDVPTLLAELEAHRALLVLLVDVEANALEVLAQLAEHQEGAFLVTCTGQPGAHVPIAHSVLDVVELRPETYAVCHRASRIGPLGRALAFSVWSGPSWDGLVDPSALEALPAAEVSPAESAVEIDAAHVELGEDPATPHVSADPAADFLRELLAHGPVDAREVEQQGAARGHHIRTLRRRAELLGVRHVKAGFQARAVWAMPTHAIGTPDQRAPESKAPLPYQGPESPDPDLGVSGEATA